MVPTSLLVLITGDRDWEVLSWCLAYSRLPANGVHVSLAGLFLGDVVLNGLGPGDIARNAVPAGAGAH